MGRFGNFWVLNIGDNLERKQFLLGNFFFLSFVFSGSWSANRSPRVDEDASPVVEHLDVSSFSHFSTPKEEKFIVVGFLVDLPCLPASFRICGVSLVVISNKVLSKFPDELLVHYFSWLAKERGMLV